MGPGAAAARQVPSHPEVAGRRSQADAMPDLAPQAAASTPIQESIRLEAVVHLDHFGQLLESFHQATGILFALLDPDGKVLRSAGWQDVCTKFHRQCPGTLERCHESDRFIKKHLGEGAFVGYRCANGLMDYAAPIVILGRHLGTLFTGQIFHEPPDEEAFRRQAREHGFDEASYLDAIRAVPVIPRVRIEAIMVFYSQLAQLVADQGVERIHRHEADRELAIKVEKLRESEARYRFLSENSVDVIWTLDPATGRFTYVSPSVERLRGMTPAEVMAEPFERALAAESRHVLTEKMPARLESIAQGDTRSLIDTARVDQPHRDGTVIPTEVVSKVITDSTGRAVEILGVTRDIRERLAAEEEQRRREELWRTIFKTSPDGIAVATVDGTVLEVSEKAATLFGYERPEELLGRNVFEFVDELHHENARFLLGEMLQGRNPGAVEYPVIRRDGSRRCAEINAEVLRDADGTPTRFFLISRDITERKQAEQALQSFAQELESRVRHRTAMLEEANKELEAFSYSVSHELRAPVRAIDGFAAIVADDHAPTLAPDGRRLFGMLRWNARRMGQLIDDLLAYSRAGRLAMHPVTVDMRAAALAAFDEVAAQPQLRARIDFQVGDLPAVEGDAAMLRLVWANLLSNAVKFSAVRERPDIRVLGEIEGDSAIYRVRDNGHGFDMMYVDKLFGVFQRLHRADEFEGTGVGLALVQRIVTRHGGRVWAEGAIGQGATVSFSLPC